MSALLLFVILVFALVALVGLTTLVVLLVFYWRDVKKLDHRTTR